MVTETEFRALALSFAETDEHPHFEKTSFRVRKKIFSTYDKKSHLACLKLSLIDQSVFSSSGEKVFYPVPNKWGLKGWTLVNLREVQKEIFADALQCAYNETAPEKLKKS